MKKNQSGFSIVEVLLVIVAILLLAGAGWYVYSSRKQASNTSSTESSNSTVSDTSEAKDPYAGWKTYTINGQGVSFKYPGDWTLGDPAPNGISFTSPDFVAESGFKKVSSGSVLAVYVLPADSPYKEADTKKELLANANSQSMSTAANVEYLTIGGLEAIYFTHNTGENLNSHETVIIMSGNKEYVIDQDYTKGASNPYPGLVKQVAASFTKE